MSYGINSPQGFKPVNTIAGGIINSLFSTRTIDPTSGAIFKNDAIKFDANKNVVQAAAGNPSLVGIFGACEFQLPSSLAGPHGERIRGYWPGNVTVLPGSQVIAYTYESPDILFDVQVDGTVVPGGYASTSQGGTANLVVNAGNVNTGLSGMTIGAIGTLATNNFKVYGLADSLAGGRTNQWGIPFNNVNVLLNTSLFNPNSVGV